MKRFWIVVLFSLSVLASTVHAQLNVGGQLPRANYMLYERIDYTVNLTNNSDSDILLNNDEEPWIRFLITDKDGLPIPSEGKATFPPLTVPMGETKNVTINITPLYRLRKIGEYKVSAVIDLPGKGEIIGPPTAFQVLNGHKIWSESRVLDGSERTFSLMAFSPMPDRAMLYMRVEDADQNAIFANLALGNVIGGVPPEAHLDANNSLHVLQCIALNTYLYSRITVDGVVEHQSVFKTSNEFPPRLVVLDGNSVTVAGGQEQNEQNRPDRLSDTQNGKIVDASPHSLNPDSSNVLPKSVYGAGPEKLPK